MPLRSERNSRPDIRIEVNSAHRRQSEGLLTCVVVDQLIVTMDGPSGTGKSTVSRAVAARAGLPHLDTGAFYRAATLAILQSGVDPEDEEAVTGVVKNLALDQSEGSMYLNGEDISAEIRGEQVTGAVSRVSAYANVRSILVEHQRRWVEQHGGRAVVEGRDIGSVVFPNAALKVYLDARPEVRAARRAAQDGDYDSTRVLKDIARRDHLDSTRSTSPLTVPDGAEIVDTSDLSFDQVVETVMDLVASKS